jgi:predicted O-linked N-acetylglucosamine transferase (SPINDLY family)
MDLRRPEDALKSYDKAIALNPNYFQAFNNRANALLDFHLPEDALKDYRKAISLNKSYVNGWVGCGNALSILARYADALLAYDDALTLNPNRTDAWVGRGNVLCELRRYDEAVAAYDKALSIKPDLECIEGGRLNAKLNLCNWERLDEELNNLTESVRSGKADTDPLVILRLSDSSDVHLRCARSRIAGKHPQKIKSVWKNTIYQHEKIHVGYVSADLHEHATAHLMAELFELYDEARFSITAFSLGRDDKSDMRRRLVSAFDRFVDCRMLSDYQVASAIADAEIDILVDLKGFTQDARTNIFAYRPAPVQVNYLGYPGTMGAPYIDYIIGDATLLSATDEPFYTEKLVQLPNSYQPNDRKRQISSKVFTRREMGLPESGFVFCCFNDSYKILPPTFASWMRILKSVERSILWLLAETQTAALNLKKQAEICSIDPSRLAFANRLDLPEHLSRHQLGDLFLDTLPYNAHTTASDALWAGVPVLTQAGNAFAGRVAASLLNAVGLPELITHSAEEYEALAVELALHPEKLKAIKQKLARNRLTMPLFNTPLYTRHLEAAYEAMYQRYQAGLPPDHIAVAPIR